MTSSIQHTVLVVGVCAAVELLASAANDPADDVMRQIRSEAIRAHVTFLADDLLEGRGTGTRGHEMAARYVASQFGGVVGIEPAGTTGYLQAVHLRSATLVPEETSVIVTQAGRRQPLSFGQDFHVFADPRELSSNVEGDVVFVGHGVAAPDFGIDEYKGLDVRGKIVAFLRGGSPELPSAERAFYGSDETKLAEAASRGAIGAIQIVEPVQPFTGGVRAAASPRLSWVGPDGSPDGGRDALRRLATLGESGTTKALGGPAPSRPGPLNVSIAVHTTSRHTDVTSPNVAALVRGSDPRLRDEFVVYTAHLDHYGIGAPVNGDAIYNGAIDNASGVASLLELARAFARLEPRARRSVLFLATTAEEGGQIGANYFAEYPTVPRSQVVANINMDGQNLQFDFRNVELPGAEHSSIQRVATAAGARLDIEVSPDSQPEQEFFRRSDQFAFAKRGIPAVFIRRGTKALDPSIDGAKLVADWFATRYHTPSDDLTQPLNWEAGAKNARFAFLLGYLIAQDDARPRWNDGDSFRRLVSRPPNR